MKKGFEAKYPIYEKNIKRIMSKHLTDTELKNLGSTKGSQKHLKKIKKATINKDYYT